MVDNSLQIEIVSFFPKGFPNKDVNEQFIKKIMSSVLPSGEWVKGDPTKFEPDYFYNGIPFEFTLASNSKKRNNFIQTYFRGEFESEKAEREAITYIDERLCDKASKNYSVKNVNVCILCLISLTEWVFDYYGSYTQVLFDDLRKHFFELIREKYIKTRVFSNVYIIFPDYCAVWWVYDVLTEERHKYNLSNNEIKSKKIPFHLIKKFYDGYSL